MRVHSPIASSYPATDGAGSMGPLSACGGRTFGPSFADGTSATRRCRRPRSGRRGAVERHYQLRPERASIDPGTAASLSPEDHRRGFAVAMAALIAEFNAYLDRGTADPATDPVGYRQHAVWLDRDELAAMNSELRDAILPRLANLPAPGRTRYLLSPILFPSEQPD